MFLSHMMFLSLSSSLPFPLSKNKEIKSYKKKRKSTSFIRGQFINRYLYKEKGKHYSNYSWFFYEEIKYLILNVSKM